MDDDYLPLSAVFRYAHCPRQAYLFLGEGGFTRCEHHGIKPSFDLEGPLVL